MAKLILTHRLLLGIEGAIKRARPKICSSSKIDIRNEVIYWIAENIEDLQIKPRKKNAK